MSVPRKVCPPRSWPSCSRPELRRKAQTAGACVTSWLIEIKGLLQHHWAPRGIFIPGENGKILHLPVAKGLNDGLRFLQVGNEWDARVHRPAADVVSIGSAEFVVFDGDVDHQVDEPLVDGVHPGHRPIFGALGELSALDA